MYVSDSYTVAVFSKGRMVEKVAAEGEASHMRYWESDTRYNTDVYNDIVSEVQTRSAEEDDVPPFSSDSEEDEDENDFVVDDEEEESEEGELNMSHGAIDAMLREKEEKEAEAALAAVEDEEEGGDAWDSDDLADIEEVRQEIGVPLHKQKRYRRNTSGKGSDEPLRSNFGYGEEAWIVGEEEEVRAEDTDEDAPIEEILSPRCESKKGKASSRSRSRLRKLAPESSDSESEEAGPSRRLGDATDPYEFDSGSD